MNTKLNTDWNALLRAAWARDRSALRTHVEGLPSEDQALWASLWANEPSAGVSLGRYRYGDQVAEVYLADGIRGLVLASGRAAPDAFLRVNDPTLPEGYRDYDWRHCDLGIRIEDGYEVAFYHLEDGRRVLDHAPETLGLERLP